MTRERSLWVTALLAAVAVMAVAAAVQVSRREFDELSARVETLEVRVRGLEDELEDLRGHPEPSAAREASRAEEPDKAADRDPEMEERAWKLAKSEATKGFKTWVDRTLAELKPWRGHVLQCGTRPDECMERTETGDYLFCFPVRGESGPDYVIRIGVSERDGELQVTSASMKRADGS